MQVWEGPEMNAMRRVHLFRNGRNQAVRIPRDMEFDADEAILRREGDRLILEPIPATPLLALLATLKPVEDKFPDIDTDLPRADDVRL
jgi:antitoxin VapB